MSDTICLGVCGAVLVGCWALLNWIVTHREHEYKFGGFRCSRCGVGMRDLMIAQQNGKRIWCVPGGEKTDDRSN